VVIYYALVFLIVGLIVGALGLAGVAVMASVSQITWILILIGVVVLVIELACDPTPPGSPPYYPEIGRSFGTGSGFSRAERIGRQLPNYLIPVVLGAIVIALIADVTVLRRLSEPGYGRGVVTFIIT